MAGPVAGGVIGGIILVLVVLIVFLVVIYLVERRSGKSCLVWRPPLNACGLMNGYVPTMNRAYWPHKSLLEFYCNVIPVCAVQPIVLSLDPRDELTFGYI